MLCLAINKMNTECNWIENKKGMKNMKLSWNEMKTCTHIKIDFIMRVGHCTTAVDVFCTCGKNVALAFYQLIAFSVVVVVIVIVSEVFPNIYDSLSMVSG